MEINKNKVGVTRFTFGNLNKFKYLNLQIQYPSNTLSRTAYRLKEINEKIYKCFPCKQNDFKRTKLKMY